MQKNKKVIDVKIESQAEQMWREIKESTEKDIRSYERLLTFSREVVEMCERKLAELQTTEKETSK